MRTFAKMTALLVLFVLGFGTGVGAQISIGISIGAPPAPRVVHVQPPRPGSSYVWVQGYWYPVGSRYTWHDGYWTRPPYQGARWVAPRHDGHQFFAGYWNGGRGRLGHDHQSDHGKERDFGGRGHQ
jgi:hypothetical protein